MLAKVRRAVSEHAAMVTSSRLHTDYSDAQVANRDALGFGTGRQKTMHERWTNPKRSRRTCSPRYGLQSCRAKSAGVAKRPRELLSPPKPLTLRFATFSSLYGRTATHLPKPRCSDRLRLAQALCRLASNPRVGGGGEAERRRGGRGCGRCCARLSQRRRCAA
jgi:hypothetical protein